MKKKSARQVPSGSSLDRLSGLMDASNKPPVNVPQVDTFRDYLEQAAMVLTKQGPQHYTLTGREALELCVQLVDEIVGGQKGKPLTDASLAICGGAQFGKTILAMHLMVYLTGVKFLNVGYYLPDDDLVQGLVDTKFRPEIVDLMPWFADMITIGKILNESGRAVNRKGAFMVTDGNRVGMGYIRGLGKIPTSFSMDAVIEDEKDDIPQENASFLPGRMTSSALRFRVSIGTQRVAGSGQNKEFEEGTQHVGQLTCSACGNTQNPEEAWPGIVRLAMDGEPRPSDPCLTNEGDFKKPGANVTAAVFDHDAHYYLGCTSCGQALPRKVTYVARRPEMIKERKFSVRISQLSISAILVKQLVHDWCANAVRDPIAMRSFRCDRLAIPKSSLQQIEPAILDRSRSVDPFGLSLAGRPGTVRWGGLDTGDRCWFIGREVAGAEDKRITWAEGMTAERVRERVPQLFNTLGLSCLFIDIGNERALARDLCVILNGLQGFNFPRLPDPEKAVIVFPGRLVWDGAAQRWRGLRCAAVEFSLKEGKGVQHKLGITQDGIMYPVIQCNRDETIQRVVDELLTAEEGLIVVGPDNRLRTKPAMRLPLKGDGEPPVADTLEKHILAGSRKEKDDKGALHFVDGIENHFLLANAYSGLAELVGEAARPQQFDYEAVERKNTIQRTSGVLM